MQVAFEVICTENLSSSNNVLLFTLYVEPVAPLISIPFFCQVYVGDPPLVGVAVNVTLVPEQTELSASLEAIETLALTVGFTVTLAEPLRSPTALVEQLASVIEAMVKVFVVVGDTFNV